MRRVLSVILSIALLLSSSLIAAQAATERMNKVWYETDFNNEKLEAPFGIRKNWANTADTAYYDFVEDGKGGKALHVTHDGEFNYGGLIINANDLVQNTNDVTADTEGVSMTFRMKAKEGQSYTVTPVMFDGEHTDAILGGNYGAWDVTDQWTEINLEGEFFKSSWASDYVNGWTNGTIWLAITDGSNKWGQSNAGDPGAAATGVSQAEYYIDDIKVTAPADIEKGTTVRATGTWYETDFDNEKLEAPFGIRKNWANTADTAYYDFVEDGKGGKALHVTHDGEFNYGGLIINASDLVQSTNDVTADTEGVSMTFRMKAKEGQSYTVTPVMFDGEHTDAILGGNYGAWDVTDQWTEINLEGEFFKSSWASGYVNGWTNGTIWLAITDGSNKWGQSNAGDPGAAATGVSQAEYYIDDIKVTAPYNQAVEVAAFAAAVEQLPEADDVVPAVKDKLDAAQELYNALSGTYAGLDKRTVDAAKAKLDTVTAAYGQAVKVAAFVDAVNELPAAEDLTVADKDKIDAAKALYEALGDPEGYTPSKKQAIADAKKKLDIAAAAYNPAVRADAFLDAVKGLPAAADITLADKDKLDTAKGLYEALGDLDGYPEAKKQAIADAKSKLDAVAAAYEKLEQGGVVDPPVEEDPPAPNEYTETFRDYPLGPLPDDKGKLIEKDPRHVREGGGRYLRITNRPAGDESNFYWHSVHAAVKAQGPGKYKLTFWAKTGGENTRILFIKAGEEYLKTPAVITGEWAQYTITMEDFPVTQEQADKGFLIIFTNNYMNNTAELYLDDIAFIKMTEDEEDQNKKNPFQPNYTMTDKTNLIAPYGDFETFGEKDLIWGQEPNSDLYTLITDSSIARSGKNCVLISGRTSQYDACSLDVTDILKAKGSGKYYMSAFIRAKTDVTGICPMLICTYADKEPVTYTMPERYLTNVAEQWTQVGVNPNQAGHYFQYVTKDDGVIHEVDTQNLRSARLVFYGNLEGNDGYKDYYIDDVAFWKYYDGQSSGEIEKPVVTVEPKYTYDNKLNLLAPYGSFETIQEGSRLWNGTVVLDPKTAHEGSKYLKISGRDPQKSPFDFCVYVTDIIKANGSGKYYYSCWLKTAEKGKTTTLRPYLYYHETGTIYEMDTIEVTDKWTRFGIAYDEVEKYFSNGEGGLPYTNGVAEFRFYNVTGEDEYPDYLVDDMAFWKYTKGQENQGSQGIPEDSDKTPTTGVPMPLLPAALTFGSAALILTAKARKRRQNKRAL